MACRRDLVAVGLPVLKDMPWLPWLCLETEKISKSKKSRNYSARDCMFWPLSVWQAAIRFVFEDKP